MKVPSHKTFDAADFINDREDILHYLNVVLEENNPGAFVEALVTIARSECLTNISQETGCSTEALDIELSTESSAQFDTIPRVCRSLGYQLALKKIK